MYQDLKQYFTRRVEQFTAELAEARKSRDPELAKAV